VTSALDAVGKVHESVMIALTFDQDFATAGFTLWR